MGVDGGPLRSRITPEIHIAQKPDNAGMGRRVPLLRAVPRRSAPAEPALGRRAVRAVHVPGRIPVRETWYGITGGVLPSSEKVMKACGRSEERRVGKEC